MDRWGEQNRVVSDRTVNKVTTSDWGLIGFLSQIGYVVAYSLSGLLADGMGNRLQIGVGWGSATVIIASGVLLGVIALGIYPIKAVQELEKELVMPSFAMTVLVKNGFSFRFKQLRFRGGGAVTGNMIEKTTVDSTATVMKNIMMMTQALNHLLHREQRQPDSTLVIRIGKRSAVMQAREVNVVLRKRDSSNSTLKTSGSGNSRQFTR